MVELVRESLQELAAIFQASSPFSAPSIVDTDYTNFSAGDDIGATYERAKQDYVESLGNEPDEMTELQAHEEWANKVEAWEKENEEPVIEKAHADAWKIKQDAFRKPPTTDDVLFTLLNGDDLIDIVNDAMIAAYPDKEDVSAPGEIARGWHDDERSSARIFYSSVEKGLNAVLEKHRGTGEGKLAKKEIDKYRTRVLGRLRFWLHESQRRRFFIGLPCPRQLYLLVELLSATPHALVKVSVRFLCQAPQTALWLAGDTRIIDLHVRPLLTQVQSGRTYSSEISRS